MDVHRWAKIQRLGSQKSIVTMIALWSDRFQPGQPFSLRWWSSVGDWRLHFVNSPLRSWWKLLKGSYLASHSIFSVIDFIRKRSTLATELVKFSTSITSNHEIFHFVNRFWPNGTHRCPGCIMMHQVVFFHVPDRHVAWLPSVLWSSRFCVHYQHRGLGHDEWLGWLAVDEYQLYLRGNNISTTLRIQGSRVVQVACPVGVFHGSECIKVAKDGELNPPFADPHGLTKLTGATITIHNSFMIFMNYKSACLLVKSCEIPSFSRWNPTSRIFLVNPWQWQEVVEALATMPQAAPMNHGDCLLVDVGPRFTHFGGGYGAPITMV